MIYFKHIEKTAGTTFKTLLRSNFGVYHLEANKSKTGIFTLDDYKFANKVFFKIEAISGHNLPSPDHLSLPDIFPVIFLRDPIERCASHYQDAVLRNGLSIPFDEWIGNPIYQNFMVRSISGSDDLDRAKWILKDYFNFVGITERFRDSLEILNLLLNEPLVLKFKSTVVASSNHIKEALLNHPGTFDLLKRFNEKDQQLYGFAMEEIFLPTFEMHKNSIIPSEQNNYKFRMAQKIKHRASIMQNNFIYRPLIKLFRSKMK